MMDPNTPLPLGAEVRLPEDAIREEQQAVQHALYLHLTPQQVNLILQIRLKAQQRILEQNYRDPADDQLSIRHRIYLDGEIAGYDFLLTFDEELTKQLEAEKQAAANATAETSAFSSTFDIHNL